MKQVNEDFDYIKVNLASPERIREWGERILPSGQIIGEVSKSDTINYRTLKPEINGLFCEKIFGPVKNWECHCGKYKQVRHQGLICEKCGVDITESRVRRHRMGYIGLLTPVTHVWYLRGVPSYLAHVLHQKLQEVEEVVYFNDSLDDDFDNLDLEDYFLNESENEFFLKRKTKKVGAEVIYEALKKINLLEKIDENREIILYGRSAVKKKTASRRLRILESFLSTHSKPEWMVLTVLPVIPPALRPIVQLEGGRFAASDLNELYRRVITRNNRLERLLKAYAPDIVVRSEKRLIQEAVDSLIDNGKRGPKTLDLNNRPLKSLADTVEGKQGRFRQNLLGKRVDYSGRSVIVVGPHLDLKQCGLPYEMVLELFYPFIVHELITKGLAGTIRNAKKIIQNNDYFLWDLVKNLIQGHPIILNRAPTLHRLGVQAFEPVLVNGRAIQLHPLVCPAFNADFDGDQMAVHIPLSLEAQTEARILMLAPNNFLSPATGEPILQPTQDMLLGAYYLSVNNRKNLKGSNHYFSSREDIILAYEQKKIALHSSVWVRFSKNSIFREDMQLLRIEIFKDKSQLKVYKDVQIKESKQGEFICQYIRTTPGRLLFNKVLNTVEKI
jgi:DNA-directed RNA polymerase subunit beta'